MSLHSHPADTPGMYWIQLVVCILDGVMAVAVEHTSDSWSALPDYILELMSGSWSQAVPSLTCVLPSAGGSEPG